MQANISCTMGPAILQQAFNQCFVAEEKLGHQPRQTLTSQLEQCTMPERELQLR